MSAAPDDERTFLDRFLAAIPIAVGVLALLSLLLWEAASRKTPTVFTDELEWSQISRSIAATGHAARRGEPIQFKSLYAFLIAPAWWIHSTATAYAAIKYLNTIAMALAAIPTFLLARTMVSRRIASIAALASLCTSAFFYAGFVVPESLAYPTFALCAWVSARALAGAGRAWIAAAVVLDLAATQVRGELVVLPAAFAIAAVLLLVVGPRAARIRVGWGPLHYAGFAALFVVAAFVLNKVMDRGSHEWAVVTEHWQGRMWSLGMQATSALAIGLGLLPMVGGLASLWIPERRRDPAWRAFAAFTGAATVTIWTYTAVKAAYLSTVFATRVEERNMIYLGPLLIVGTAVWLRSRPWLLGSLAALAFTAWLVLYYGYQLDYPYFEAPGYGIAAMANRSWSWDQPAIRFGLAVACAVLLAIVLVAWASRIPPRWRNATVLLAVATTFTWMLAGEISSSRGATAQSRLYAGNFTKPFDWVDRTTDDGGTTFIGQNIDSGQALGINLLEFWNRSIKHIASLDGTAPGPGPVITPDLADRFGTLRGDPGLRYVVTTDRIELAGTLLSSRPGETLWRIDRHPWRLRDASYGVSDDGWISGTSDNLVATGTYAYFGPTRTRGTLAIAVGRPGFCASNAPSTHITLRVGLVSLNEQRAPVVARPTNVIRLVLPNCSRKTISVTAVPPVAVVVTADPTFRPSDYGISDSRELGAQVGFSFTPKR